jgi:hypothetical protein
MVTWEVSAPRRISDSPLGTCCFSENSSLLYYIDEYDVLAFDIAKQRVLPRPIARGLGAGALSLDAIQMSRTEKGTLQALLVDTTGDHLFVERRICDPRDKEPHAVHVWHKRGLAVSPVMTQKSLLLAGRGEGPKRSHELIRYGLAGALSSPDVVAGFESPVTCIAVDPKDEILAVGTLGGELTLIGTKKKNHRMSLKGFDSAIQTLQFSSDSKFLIAGSSDRAGNKNLIMFQLPAGRKVFSGRGGPDGVLRACFNNSTTILAAIGSDNIVKVWKVR